MDPLTHSLFGLVLGKSGLHRRTPSWPWIAIIASNAPDLDSVFEPFADLRHLVWHRHFTHSLFFLPLVALFSLLIVRYILRRPLEWRAAFFFALFCTGGHVFCDWLTYRGERLFLPFDASLWHLQTQWLIDPVLISLLVLALGIPFLSKLVSGEIGAKSGSGAITAIVMLCLCGGWFYTRFLIRQAALAELNSRVYEGLAPRRIDVLPTANPLRFQGLVETDTAFKEIPIDLREYFDPEDGQTYFKPVFTAESGRAAQLAGAVPEVQSFLSWAHWPRWQVQRYDGEARWVVLVEELAFENHRTHPRVVVKLNERYQVLETTYEAAQRKTSF